MGAHRLSAAVLAALALLTAGCGSSGSGGARTAATEPAGAGAGAIPRSLARASRPIGHGARFAPPARGPVLGACRRALGRRDGVHVELFAADRVMLVAAGIGTRPPRRMSAGRIAAARCYGSLVTLEPTGVVLVSPGARATVGDLFRSWGQPLTGHRLATFTGRVHAFVDGRPWTATPASAIPLRRHAEIVLEVGPHVPPHAAYHFPPGT